MQENMLLRVTSNSRLLVQNVSTLHLHFGEKDARPDKCTFHGGAEMCVCFLAPQTLQTKVCRAMCAFALQRERLNRSAPLSFRV